MRICDYPELKSGYLHDTLMETSKDTAKTPNDFMTLKRDKVVNMDKLKRDYCNMRGMSENVAKSADALVELTDEGLCVIEFKNGDFSCEEISCKALESIMIINDLLSKSIGFSRKEIEFALVYNEEVKKPTTRQLIAWARAKRGFDDYDFWGLGNLRNFCYRDVHLIEKHEFDDSCLCKRIAGI